MLEQRRQLLMNEYVLYILCSDNKTNNFIERCIKSIDTEIDVVIMMNSNDKFHIDRVKQLANQNKLFFASSESTGYPGTGRNACIEHFANTNYQYMIQIDCDDNFFPSSLNTIKNSIKGKDCVLLRFDYEKAKKSILPFEILDDYSIKASIVFSAYSRVVQYFKYLYRPCAFSKKVIFYNFKYEDSRGVWEDFQSSKDILNNLNLDISFIDMLDNFNYTHFEKNGAMVNFGKKVSDQEIIEFMTPYIQNIKNALVLRNLNHYIID